MAPAPLRWARYTHHRQATIEEWDSGETRKKTRGKGRDSQYNPHLFYTDEQVQALELRCIQEGVTIKESGHRITKYLRLEGTIVGACRGMETEYVFAECTSGDYHGRPISTLALRDMGVDV